MTERILPNLPDEIITKIIARAGEDSVWHLRPFMRAGKRGYRLVHDPYVLQKCNVTPMLDYSTREVGNNGKFHKFNRKCVASGNKDALYYEGLNVAAIVGLQESIYLLKANVPEHAPSTFAVGIFNVCLGNDKEATKVFKEFAAIHADLRSDAIDELGDELQSRLLLFDPPYMNTYASTFKFPDDELIKAPKCRSGHDYGVQEEGPCKNCKLFWICSNVSHLL